MKSDNQEIVLGVESEWGLQGQILADFGKLMCVKSPRKLLLFSTKNHQGGEEIVHAVESDMNNYPHHVAGEEYLLIEVTAPGAFRYGFRVPNDGQLSNVQFQVLDPTPLAWPWQRTRTASA